VTNDLAFDLVAAHEAEVVVEVLFTLEQLHAAAVVTQPVLFVDAH